MTDNAPIQVPLPTDQEGLTGRKCPSCEGYFKVKFGTGLSVATSHCPYCETERDQSDFATPEQIEHAISVAMPEIQDKVIRPAVQQFEQDLQQMSRSQPFNSLIRLDFKLDFRQKLVPIAHYRERDLETAITCENCNLEFAVYGVFARCPDCAEMNAGFVFHKSMEAASRRLGIYDDTEDAEIREVILSDTLGAAVGAFDAVGKELLKRFPGLLPSKPPNLFQNIDRSERRHAKDLRSFAQRPSGRK